MHKYIRVQLTGRVLSFLRDGTTLEMQNLCIVINSLFHSVVSGIILQNGDGQLFGENVSKLKVN